MITQSASKEKACDDFFLRLDRDYDFKCWVMENFLSDEEMYYECKFGRDDPEAYERAFDRLWKENPSKLEE